MLESLHIEGFRKYKDFTFNGFNRITFILGENNIGKTSALEAIYTWACGQNTFPFPGLPLSRGRYVNFQTPFWVMEELLSIAYDRRNMPIHMVFDGIYDGRTERFEHIIRPSDLLMQFDSSYKNSIEKPTIITNNYTQNQLILPSGLAATLIAEWDIAYNGNKPEKGLLTVPYTSTQNVQSPIMAKFIDLLSYISVQETVQMYARLKREGLLDEVVKEMQGVFPEIKGFDMIPYPDGSQAPVSIENKDGNYLPLYAYGDGVQKWFYIFGALTMFKQSIICIDEVDTGFHPDAQTDFCVSMMQTAIRNDVQLFLTTHNIEFIDNVLNTVVKCPELAESVSVITMRNTNDGLRTRNLSAKEALNAREIYNMELR